MTVTKMDYLQRKRALRVDSIEWLSEENGEDNGGNQSRFRSDRSPPSS
jgi:hypothetical protein